MNRLRIFCHQWPALLLIFSIIVPSFASDVPVLIWGGGDSAKSMLEPVNLFKKTSQVEFQQVFTKKVGDSLFPVLVFYRENFCNEDVTLHDKDQLKQLEKLGSFQYIPAVDSPLSVFNTLPFYNQSLEEELESVSDGQLVITRATDLEAIPDTFKILKESNPNLIGVLTGKFCSHGRSERVRRAADISVKEDNKTILIQTDRVLFYLDEAPILALENSEFMSVGTLGSNATDEIDGDSVILKLEFVSTKESVTNKTRLDFNISSSSMGYHSLKIVKVYRNDEPAMVLSVQGDVTWPRNFSYHCTQHTMFSNKNNTARLGLLNMQIQLDPVRTRFDDAYDCVGFTSIAIWTGIFVTTILAMIMIWGLTMIIDIRTMDRFDDPKGKTITISSTE